MSFFTQLIDLNSEVYYLGIHVPAPEAEAFLGEGDRRVLCSLNGEKAFACALMPDGNGDYYINLNKERRDRYGVAVGDMLEVQLEKDESKYGMPVPEEMAAVLETDPEGAEVFQRLTPGKQRSLLYIIGKPKSSDLRIHKALSIIEYLKSTGGKLDFKALSQVLKRRK